MCGSVHTRVRECARACAGVCTRVCGSVRACVRECARVCAGVCTRVHENRQESKKNQKAPQRCLSVSKEIK